MKFYFLFLFQFLFLLTVIGQEDNPKDKLIFTSPNYELQFPFGDMKKDFGVNSTIGLELGLISPKNIFYSISYSYLFGNNVKDSTILNHLMDEDGNIIDQNGQISDILLQERGYNINLKLGYLLPILNDRSGLLSYASIGYHQHKVNIDVKNSAVPQLNENYKKIYDQLAGGVSSSIFIGYLNISQKTGLHFYSGLELSRAFSKNQRSYNFNSNMAVNEVRNDLFLGLKVGWIIPISKRSNKEYYYF
ncbi:MAG: hypothetical protein ACON5E_06205 [Flavobacteriales bacterium]